MVAEDLEALESALRYSFSIQQALTRAPHRYVVGLFIPVVGLFIPVAGLFIPVAGLFIPVGGRSIDACGVH